MSDEISILTGCGLVGLSIWVIALSGQVEDLKASNKRDIKKLETMVKSMHNHIIYKLSSDCKTIELK